MLETGLRSFMFGSHLSVAGGLVNALNEAESQRMECVQIFTKNQRQWNAKPLEQSVVDDWLSKLHELGWEGRTVSHASYLINLASPEASLRKKSADAMTDELERCETLSVPGCVMHPGSHRETGLEAGIKRIAKGIDEIIRRTKGFQAKILLETTVGAGAQIGGKFEHLAAIRDLVKIPERVGTCVDSCHISAAGYDISTEMKAKAVFQEYDSVVGFDNLQCFHLNDSKEPIGSRKDRHEHIGKGFVGKGGFVYIVNEVRFRSLPMILETDKKPTPKGTPMDVVNIRRLKKMIRRDHDG